MCVCLHRHLIFSHISLSYHRDTATALLIVDFIRKSQPHFNVFFDQKDLKVGSTWQLKLYASIGEITFFVEIFTHFIRALSLES